MDDKSENKHLYMKTLTSSILEPKPKGEVLFFGFLKKRSKYFHLWKTRFCILTSNYLFAFTGVEKDADCTLALPLKEILQCSRSENIIKNSFYVETIKDKFYFKSKNNDIEIWIEQISNQLNSLK